MSKFDIPKDLRHVVQVYTAADRDDLIEDALSSLNDPAAIVAQKTARVIARTILAPFVVDTEHGQMLANAGDYLVTNHPDDDPSSDVWPVSAERFSRSYKEVEA